MPPAPPPLPYTQLEHLKGEGHRGEATEGEEEEDATPDLLLKHPDATLVTYVLRLMKYLKHAYETLVKTPKNT
jgi:hypothetical protein